MKTKFTTIIATVALLLSTSTLTFAGVKTDDNGAAVTSTELKQVGKIDAIEASGNVDVYIMNGDNDAVKVYSDYYGENAVVQNEDGVLRIASYGNDKLMVLVTVSDLHSITANDEAFVKTYGDALSAKSLLVDLNDKAVAVLKLDAIAAGITVNGDARADLYGMVENYSLARSATSTVNKDQLESYASRVKTLAQPKAARTHAFVNLGANAALLN
ncbi:GIN domain-containing protein [Mucilaginibacter auburnensis]|uniref:Putative auto-transporter adhesin head GIN domain-containing protein n=1 Tax=Mucilaginibacter auburnensis TaxID=1457233 RepID=A0A2H9VLL5_9SPHI|nr:DUF2807 domain-containing protein [Mucilaginibacter auburnensis]PJJ79214.1 hypothetical protein CLV57_2340 [Mucilaginibacter auburnensis]